MSSEQELKRINARRRRNRVRTVVQGTGSQPRLSVHISNTHISAQLIDDSVGTTLAYASTVGNKTTAGNMTQKAEFVGKAIAAKAAKAKVKKVVLDRGSRKYHGRLKALAEAARAEGLVF